MFSVVDVEGSELFGRGRCNVSHGKGPVMEER